MFLGRSTKRIQARLQFDAAIHGAKLEIPSGHHEPASFSKEDEALAEKAMRAAQERVRAQRVARGE